MAALGNARAERAASGEKWGNAEVEKFLDLVAPFGEALRQLRRQRGELAATSEPQSELSAQGPRAAQQLVEAFIGKLCGQRRHARFGARNPSGVARVDGKVRLTPYVNVLE